MKRAIHITEAEWEVMAVIWEQAPVAATTILEATRARRDWTLATVRTLLRRLVNKGAVEQRADGRRFVYTASVSIDACIKRESESFLNRVLGRAPSAALLHLVEKATLSRADIQELRRVLREKERTK